MTRKYSTRREFVVATGTSALTASLAGCQNSISGDDAVNATLFLPFSGPAQALGKGMAAGAEIAIENSDFDINVGTSRTSLRELC